MHEFFNGKVAVVTGGASGIGKATVLEFLKRGASVAIVDINNEAGEKLASSLQAEQFKVKYFSCQLTDESAIKESMQQVYHTFGRLDFAYNNAGIGGEFAAVADYPTDDWDKVMAINLRAVFLCMKYQIPFLLQQKHSAIVNCASVLSTVAYENDSAYVASKFGVLGLTKTAALEYAKTGLRINAISPGFTRTPMIDKGDPEKERLIAAKHPVGRLAEPEEMAKAVLWLCSQESSFAIGLNLTIDGGYTLI